MNKQTNTEISECVLRYCEHGSLLLTYPLQQLLLNSSYLHSVDMNIFGLQKMKCNNSRTSNSTITISKVHILIHFLLKLSLKNSLYFCYIGINEFNMVLVSLYNVTKRICQWYQ